MLSLTLQRSVSLSKTTHIPLTDVLNTLHDPVLLVNLGPLVVDHTVDPSETELHHVTDKISILGLFHTRTKFTVKFTLVEDGVISSVNAGFGTVVRSQWRARTITGGGTEILEESSVKGFFLLMPYIINTIRSSHAEFLDRLTANLEKRDVDAE